MTMLLLFSPMLAYLVGSIPFGMIITRLAGLGDIRKIGSGNIGATNVLRTGHKSLAALTLILDGAKGAVVVLVAQYYINNFLPLGLINNNGVTLAEQSFWVFMLGTFAVIGHMFPVWLKFKGGKGVATFFGMILALSPIVGITALAIWLSTAIITRYSSVAALMATFWIVVMFWGILIWTTHTAPSPYAMAVTEMPLYDLYSCLALVILTALIWLRHHENIARLIKNTETKIGQSAS